MSACEYERIFKHGNPYMTLKTLPFMLSLKLTIYGWKYFKVKCFKIEDGLSTIMKC